MSVGMSEGPGLGAVHHHQGAPRRSTQTNQYDEDQLLNHSSNKQTPTPMEATVATPTFGLDLAAVKFANLEMK